jgi:hypothetical protein
VYLARLIPMGRLRPAPTLARTRLGRTVAQDLEVPGESSVS